MNTSINRGQGKATITNDDTLTLMLDASGPAANQAAAIDSLLLVRDPFHVISLANWMDLGSDQNTRVIIFSTFQLSAGETPAAVTIQLVDFNGQIHDLAAEDVTSFPGMGFSQIRFRLPDSLAAGICSVIVKARGQSSSTATFRIAP